MPGKVAALAVAVAKTGGIGAGAIAIGQGNNRRMVSVQRHRTSNIPEIDVTFEDRLGNFHPIQCHYDTAGLDSSL